VNKTYPITEELNEGDVIVTLQENALLIKKPNGYYYKFLIPEQGLNTLKSIFRGEIWISVN